MKMLNSTFQTWWHEQQIFGELLQLANIFQHNKCCITIVHM